jgi:hypothetical protein
MLVFLFRFMIAMVEYVLLMILVTLFLLMICAPATAESPRPSVSRREESLLSFQREYETGTDTKREHADGEGSDYGNFYDFPPIPKMR